MTLNLYGLPGSTFVWTTRLLLHEKSVAYDMAMKGADGLFTMHRSPDLDRHPFRKVPILEHDGRRIFETQAICRYIDRVFDGPVFTPRDPYDAAINDQWMGAIATYLDTAVIRRLVLPIVIGKSCGEPPDAARIKAAATEAERPLSVVNEALEGKTFLTGNEPVLADLFLWPILHYMKRIPATARLLKSFERLEVTMDAAALRPSFIQTTPV